MKNIPRLSAIKIQEQAQMLSNRCLKRFKHLNKRFKKETITCFRLYDWDIPEIRAVVDWYAGQIVIAEYERAQSQKDWLPAMAEKLKSTFDLMDSQIHLKRRRTNVEEKERYERLDSQNQFIHVQERDLTFKINLRDYLDTGLYSDHRDTRLMIQNASKDKSFLNLFAYTGAFSCAAAKGGAKEVVTVDRSSTYIEWARENFEINGLPVVEKNFIQSDVSEFLENERKIKKCYDLIFVDPPSFYNDKKQKVRFDINRDHPQLLKQVSGVLKPSGCFYFSTNHQRFKPQFQGFKNYQIQELTPNSIPEDYRNRTIHRCWKFERKKVG